MTILIGFWVFFTWRRRKIEMPSLGFSSFFFLMIPFSHCPTPLYPTIYPYNPLSSYSLPPPPPTQPPKCHMATILASIRDKSVLKKKKTKNFIRYCKEDVKGRSLQASVQRLMYSGSSIKWPRRHESSMNRTVYLSPLTTGSFSRTKFRKYMLWLR